MNIYGQPTGGFGMPKTFVITDNSGNEITGVVVGEKAVFTANAATDIREGKVAATDEGVITGSAFIPNYNTYTGAEIISDGEAVSLYIENAYDYTKLQAIICSFNTSVADSVSAQQVVIDDQVLSVQSTNVISSVTKNLENASIDFGFTNTSGNLYLVRYFLYKELY